MPDPNREYEEARRLLVRAVAEIKGGEKNIARRYLERVLNVPARSDQKADAYFWLSEISGSDSEKRSHLHSALGYDLTHHRARKSLAILDGRLKVGEIIDPDTFEPEKIDPSQPRQGKRFECPNCGSRMVFSPDGGSLYCEYCNAQSGIAQAAQLNEYEFVIGISTAQGHQHVQATQAFECQACGAVYLLSPAVISLVCPHCGSTYAVIQPAERELIPPEGIIPFQLEESVLEEVIGYWGKQQGFEPSSIQIADFSGIYLPCWTFDVGGEVKWTGYLEVQENHTIPVQESAVIHYDDIFIPASKPQPKFLMDLIEGFCAADIVSYAPEYIANFLAESYQISMSDAALEARSLAFGKAKKAQLDKHGLRKVQSLNFTSDDIFLESFKLVLVPIWVGHVTIEGRLFEALINGKTGRVFMEKPPRGLRKLSKWLREN
jgi:predicted RNA-binding Zn-ribbon protein involved in translation (DUF1610 family)